MKLKTMVDALLNSIYPPDCIFCGASIPQDVYCCSNCAETVKPNLSKGEIRLSQEFALPYCALYDYDVPVKYAVHSLKFHDRKSNGAIMGVLLAESDAIRNFLREADCITAVPISRKRRANRGYNQAELIAKPLAERCNLPYENLLEKHVDNGDQSTLTRQERLENVVGVYRKARKADIANKSIVLVDDIITTGATLYACAAVLYEAGAKAVSAVTFAHSKLS